MAGAPHPCGRARYLFVGHSGSHFVIRRCRLEGGVDRYHRDQTEATRNRAGSSSPDNVIEGPTRLASQPGHRGTSTGVTITGAGHVVGLQPNERSRGRGSTEAATAACRPATSTTNDIEASTDDGIEGDEADTNVRIFRNRITNAFSGISAQPANGGPPLCVPQCDLQRALLSLQAPQTTPPGW